MKIKEVTKYVAGSLAAAMLLIMTATMVVYPAVDQLIGLAVIGSADGTVWNNVKDSGIQTDGNTTGMLSTGLFGFNGATWDRLRSSVANGLQVDVTRISGTVTVVGNNTPSDAYANPTNAVNTISLNSVLNGAATWDRIRSILSDNQSIAGVIATGNMLWNQATASLDRWRGGVASVQGGSPLGALFNSQNVSAVNTNVAVTITGTSGQRAHLYAITRAVCSAVAGTPVVQVEDGAGNVIFARVATTTDQFIPFPVGLTGTTATNMIITLTACGTGNTGILAIQADRF